MAMFDIVWTVLLTLETLFADKSVSLHIILLLFILFWVIIEILMMVKIG